MRPSLDSDSFRSLSHDDIDGVCSVYPPDRELATTSRENRHGFSSQCGDAQCAAEDGGGSVGSGGREPPRTPALPAFRVALWARLARRRAIV